MREWTISETALRDRELQLRLALEASLALVFEWDVREDRVRRLVSNDPALPRTEDGSDNFDRVVGAIHPDDRDGFRRAVAAALRSADGAYAAEYRTIGPDGAERWLADRGRVEFDGNRRPVRLIGIAHDVTDRKRIEADRAADLEAMTRLHRIGSLFVREGDLTPVLNEILGTAMAIARADYGTVQLRDAETGRLRIAAQRGFSQDWCAFWDDSGLGRCAASLARGERVIVADIEEDPLFAGTPGLDVQRRADVRSVQSTPVLNRAGVIVGVFSTHWRAPHRPADRELRLLDLLAGQVADIVERTEAERSLIRRNRQLDVLARASNAFLLATGDGREAIETVLRSIADLLGVESFYHYRPSADPDWLDLALAGGIGEEERRLFGRMKFGELLCGRVAETRRRLVVEDLQESVQPGADMLRAAGATSYAGFPLVADGALIGTVAFISRRLTHFREGDIQAIQAVCDQMAAALERNRLMRALRSSEARLTMALEAGQAGTWESTPATGEFTASDAALRLHGLLPGTPMSHETALAAVHPDDRAALEAAIGRTLETGEPLAIDLRTVAPDGTVRWLHSQARLRHDGGQARLVGLVQDISERKREEEDLRRNEARQAFLLKLTDAIRPLADPVEIEGETCRLLAEELGVDRAYFVEVDEAAGWARVRRDYVRGDTPSLAGEHRVADFAWSVAILRRGDCHIVSDIWSSDIVPPADRPACAALQIVSCAGAPWIKDGRLRGALCVTGAEPHDWQDDEIALLRDAGERIWAAIERARAEDALRAAHDTFRNLVDRSPFGIYAVDADFRLVQVSDGAREIFRNVRPLIGRDFAEVLRVIWPEPFATEAIERFRHTLATGEPYRAPGTVEQRADTAIEEAYDWKIERINLPDGRPGVVCHFYDLSERQRHEEHNRLLLREVNHRAKNMLGLVQAIARQTSAASPRDFVEGFTQRIQALSASQDVLVKSGWRNVPFETLVRAQLSHFADLIGHRIRLSGAPLPINAAAAQSLGMALHELATNAAKYGALANDTGIASVSWRVVGHPDEPRFELSWVESGGPPVTRPARRGFGSTVTGSLVSIGLDGEVEIDFAADGLVWRLFCPAARVVEGEGFALRHPPEAPAVPSQAHPRVLVVEDEPLIAVEVAQMVEEAGYQVLGPVGSVARAMALLDRSECEAAILDVSLGSETSEPVARRLSASRIPFVVVSGYSRDQLPPGFGSAPLLGKPANPSVVKASLERCLAAAS